MHRGGPGAPAFLFCGWAGPGLPGRPPLPLPPLLINNTTAEDWRKRGDENFEEAWEEYKEKFEQDEDENLAKYYRLLGLKQSATYDELRQRFRELALKYHPDKNKTKKIQAAKKFTKILEAYEKIIERMKKCAV